LNMTFSLNMIFFLNMAISEYDFLRKVAVVYSDFVICLSSVLLTQILKSVSYLAILVMSMKYTVKKSTILFFKTQLGRLSLTLNHFCICFDDKNSKTMKINQLKLNIFVNKNKSKSKKTWRVSCCCCWQNVPFGLFTFCPSPTHQRFSTLSASLSVTICQHRK